MFITKFIHSFVGFRSKQWTADLDVIGSYLSSELMDKNIALSSFTLKGNSTVFPRKKDVESSKLLELMN